MPTVICHICNHTLDTDTTRYKYFNERYVCMTCLREHYIKCSVCNKYFKKIYNHNTESNPVCKKCLSSIIPCDHCRRPIAPQQSHFIKKEKKTYCYSCFRDYYEECIRCEQPVKNKDACYCEFCCEYYCPTCFKAHHNDCNCRSDYNSGDSENYIYDHEYKPKPIFHGKGIHYGIELEVDDLRDLDTLTYKLYKKSKQEKLFYLKEDGSISCGFEIVTHPMTLDYHVSKMNWEHILDLCAQNSNDIHNNRNTCGLHIHIEKKGLGNTNGMIELTTLKLLYIFEKFWKDIWVFSRRQNDYYCKQNVTNYKLKDIKKQREQGRYTAINLLPFFTIEVRIFKGTLDVNTILASIEFIHGLVTVLPLINVIQIQKITWDELMDQILDYTPYPHLEKYLIEKNLYVSKKITLTKAA